MQHLPRLRGDRRSKVTPHPIDLLRCSLEALREQIGDVGRGDDSKSQARRFCRRQVDQADLSGSSAVAEHGSQGGSLRRGRVQLRPLGQPRPKIDPWRDRLDGLLETNDRRPKRARLTLVWIYEELRNLGYDGSYDAVRR